MDDMKEQVEVKEVDVIPAEHGSKESEVPAFPKLSKELLATLENGVENIQSLLDSGEKVDINNLFKNLSNSVGVNNKVELSYYLVNIFLEKLQNKENAYPYFKCLYSIRFAKGGGGKEQLESIYPNWNNELQFIFSLYDLAKDLINKTEKAKSTSQKSSNSKVKFAETKKQFNSYVNSNMGIIVEQQDKILYSFDFEVLQKLKTSDAIKTAKVDGIDTFKKALDERINLIKPKQGEDAKRFLSDSKPKRIELNTKKAQNSEVDNPIVIAEEQMIEDVVSDTTKPVKIIVPELSVIESPKEERIEDREVSNDGDRISIILELSLIGSFDRIKDYLESIAHEQGSDSLSRILRACLNLSPDDNALMEQFARYIAYASTESESNSFDTFRFMSQLMKGQLDRKTQEFILIVFDHMSKYGRKGCKEARVYKRQLDHSEVVYQEKICNSLGKPLGKVEQTMSNLRTQDKPAKEVMGTLMDQIAGIHYALEECGVESVGTINKWIEQAPVSFDANNHCFDTAVVPDPTKPVTLRTIGLKARDSDVIIKSIVKPVEEGDRNE